MGSAINVLPSVTTNKYVEATGKSFIKRALGRAEVDGVSVEHASESLRYDRCRDRVSLCLFSAVACESRAIAFTYTLSKASNHKKPLYQGTTESAP
jgi:hypothetical protein